MALKTARDRRLTGQNSLTNVLSGTATTGTGGVTEEETKPGITGTPKEGAGAGPVTTTQAQQQNQQQAQQQSQQQSNVATKMPKQPARSGMFTNVKKILEKNQPAVQQMGQQAGQQFATTAEKVKQQAQQQFQNVQGQIQQAQKDVQAQEQAGKEAIESVVTSPLPEETAPVEETEETPATAEELLPEAKGPTLADFGSTAEQIAQGTSQLDLGKKIQEARELQAQAQGIMTDASKRNLLRDVFGRGQKQYTSGAQSLDNLLLAMSPQAGKQLTETVQQSARGLGDISRLQSEGERQYKRLLESASGIGGRLGEASQRSLDQLFDDVEAGTEEFKKERSDYLSNFAPQVTEALNKLKEQTTSFFQQDPHDIINQLGFKQTTNNRGKHQIVSISKEDLKKQYENRNFKYVLGDFENFLKMVGANKDGSVSGTTHTHQVGNLFDKVKRVLALTNAIEATFKKANEASRYKTDNEGNFIRDEQGNPIIRDDYVEYIHPMVAGIIKEKTGKSYVDLLRNKDIQEENYYEYSDEEIAKINALKRLRGETDFIIPSKQYTTIEDLKSIDYFNKLLGIS